MIAFESHFWPDIIRINHFALKIDKDYKPKNRWKLPLIGSNVFLWFMTTVQFSTQKIKAWY